MKKVISNNITFMNSEQWKYYIFQIIIIYANAHNKVDTLGFKFENGNNFNSFWDLNHLLKKRAII